MNKNSKIFAYSAGAVCLFAIMIKACDGPDEPLKDAKYAAWAYSKELIKSQLNTPATAKFPLITDAKIEAGKDSIYGVSAYVDAQNVYGANVRSNFYCELKYTGGNTDSTQNWDIVTCGLIE